MHFEILVEDLSGQKALSILLPKILGNRHTIKIHHYRGIGGIPKNLHKERNQSSRILLNQLPRLLRGYGNAFKVYPENSIAVVVICDLDKRCLKEFKQELVSILNACNPGPKARFCIAIEEGEAWFLGDIPAVKKAYPKAKESVLKKYNNDSICGTWEVLANSVYKGGVTELSKKGWQSIGAEKFDWATRISPHMDINSNKSPSFNYLKKTLLTLVEEEIS
ncbi:MAG: DUF4276 family protein [bacterium]|nr:DUF4276 family protein [bacterium]